MALGVSASISTDGAVIYYTTDGSTPGPQSDRYDGPSTITETTSVIAVGVKRGMKSSGITHAPFTKFGR